ncbi:MAG: hypothetical protein KC505_06215 [Myxococcales bacterium]|nr:hypothetical protein [Myxococcales bacterium]USN51852.1 MAG: hypothetical protein H6731_05445 [Myxococcales bacterium]
MGKLISFFGVCADSHSVAAIDEPVRESEKSFSYENNHEAMRKILLTACENYRLILPKQLGCYLCQLSHQAVGSTKSQHVNRRLKQLDEFEKLIKKDPFVLSDIEYFFEKKMGLFNGNYGKIFHTQCLNVMQSFPSEK